MTTTMTTDRHLDPIRYDHATELEEVKACLAKMLEYAECNDPGCPHIPAARRLLGASAEGHKP